MKMLRKLWRGFYGTIVMIHADIHTEFYRLKLKYGIEDEEQDVEV